MDVSQLSGDGKAFRGAFENLKYLGRIPLEFHQVSEPGLGESPEVWGMQMSSARAVALKKVSYVGVGS